MSIAQFIISIPLFFFLAFGLGFIINMLLKTTWAPFFIYIIVVIISSIFIYFRNNSMLRVIDFIVLLAGFAGAWVSGWTILTLRRKGYRMF